MTAEEAQKFKNSQEKVYFRYARKGRYGQITSVSYDGFFGTAYIKFSWYRKEHIYKVLLRNIYASKEEYLYEQL